MYNSMTEFYRALSALDHWGNWGNWGGAVHRSTHTFHQAPSSSCPKGNRPGCHHDQLATGGGSGMGPSGELADRRTPTAYQVLPHRAVEIYPTRRLPRIRRYAVTMLY